MPLNDREKIFISSINEKIKRYTINTNLKETFAKKSGYLVETIYNNNEVEVVDSGIELYLIKKSFNYFLNKYCRVDIPGIGNIPMEPYYFQVEMAKEVLNYRKIIVDKSRQVGISTIFSLYALWRIQFFASESIDVVSLRQLKSQQFVKKMRSTLNNLPKWMQLERSADNQQKLGFVHPNGAVSEILSESQSDNAGRSDSLSLLILDEAAHYQSEKMIRGIVASAQPTLNKTGGTMVVISTPNGTSGKGAWYYEQVEAAKLELENDTKYLEIDWWEVPDDKRIKGPKKGYNNILEKAIQEDYYYNKNVKEKYKKFFDPIAKEYWKDNSWLKASMDDLQELTYKQEILHEFVIGGSKVFSESTIDRIKENIKPPKYKDYIDKTEVKGFWVWKRPTPKHRYIIGVDISSGTSNDYSSIQVFDTIEYEQAAEYKGFISTPNLSRLINKVAKAYNNAYVVIECNSIGDGVFNALYYNENDPYRNVFKQKKTKNGVTRMTGWITDVKTRKLIANEFIDWITVDDLWNNIKIYSSRLHEEIKTWVWKTGNKAEHADGCVSGETIITCKDGFKQIKDVKVGDYVLTHLGNFKRVEKTFKFKDDKKIMREVEAYGFPKLKISADQEMLTYENDSFVFKDGFKLKEGDGVYSMFNKRSNNVSRINSPNQTAIGSKIAGVQSEIKIPEIEKIFNDLKKGIVDFDLMFTKKENYKHILLSIINNNGIYKGNKNFTFKNKNIYINYFIANMLYKNNIAFSFANNIIKLTYTNYNDLAKFLNIEQVKTDKFRSSRVWKKRRLNSTIKSIKEIDWNDYYYDLTVEDDHSYIANGYVVHNCHDDSIIAMALCLYNRSKAQVSEKIFAISDKGETIEFNSKEVEEEDTSSYTRAFAFVEDDDEDNPFGSEQDIYEWLMR